MSERALRLLIVTYVFPPFAAVGGYRNAPRIVVTAGVAAVLAYSEHSAGNDTYEKYKDLVMAGDDAAAEIQFDKTGTHDDKAQTWMIVSGLLAGAYILQEFILDRGGDDRAALERSSRLRLGWDPCRGEANAAVVLLPHPGNGRRAGPGGQAGPTVSPLAPFAGAASPFIFSRTSSIPSSRKRLCMEQNCGPHIEQNSALL